MSDNNPNMNTSEPEVEEEIIFGDDDSHDDIVENENENN